jgi:hypothetical protein
VTSCHDALAAAGALATIRSYFAAVAVDYHLRWPEDDKLWREVSVARARLAGLVPSLEIRRPESVEDAEKLQHDVIATVLTTVRPDGLAERALGVGLAFIDVTVAATLADRLDFVLESLPDAQPPRFVKRFEETLRVFDSARESLARAIDRFAEGLDPNVTSRVVGERAARLKRVAGPGWRRDRWRTSSPEALRQLVMVLTFPPEGTKCVDGGYPWQEEQAIFAEILEHPYDDAPRLKWAELVSTRDEARAALVRDQLERRSMIRRTGVAFGDSDLAKHVLDSHPEWADDVRRLGAEAAVFVGGFVEDITIRAEAFVENGAKLLGAAPIRRVRLTQLTGHFDALLASGLLGRVEWLDLSHQNLDDTELEAIVRAPNLTHLRGLSLESNRITNHGVRVLWVSPMSKTLAFCGLDRNPCSPLLIQELTHHEMSVYEWVPTELAMQLEAELGPRKWACQSPEHLDLFTAQ